MRKVNVVAECCCNHLGDLATAKEMIRVAKSCGADYVKFQKRDIECMPNELRGKPYAGPHSFGATYGEHRFMLEFSPRQFQNLKDFADIIGIGFFATPFDVPSAQFLVNELQCEYVKMGSTQIHDESMVEWFANRLLKSKIIMSSGMLDKNALAKLCDKIGPNALMQTTSAYPCDESAVNLLVLNDYPFTSFETGLSGHYVSGNGAIEAAAVALGATWIERHFTLDRSWKGSDQAASLEPAGLHNVVKAVRTVERALGDEEKRFEDCERPTWEKIKK